MIFASDLDRTLIYSKKFLSDVSCKYVLIEQRDGEDISYISEKALELLRIINSSLTFIPTTTRSKIQYERINFKAHQISPKYAIVANGGIILDNGLRDPYWDKHMKNMLSKILPLSTMYEKLDFFLKSIYIKSFHSCEDLFIYGILDTSIPIPTEIILTLEKLCHNHDYILSIQGRKIYFIPKVINKGLALRYMIEKLDDSLVIASGDSNLDFPMLKQCHYPIVPSHHSLESYLEDIIDKTYLTSTSGIHGGEEIVREVYRLLNTY